MSYDPDQHHRRSIRLPDFDYSRAGAYFVTIAFKERQCLLGEVVNGEMRLSKIGETVATIWESLPERYPGVDLDEIGMMPNHMHGIIVITPEAELGSNALEADRVEPGRVGAVHELPLRAAPTGQGRRRMLLPRIIGYFKMNTAERANLLRATPGQPFWQRDYFEHVIRNRVELAHIRDYIASNPLKWELDQLHPDNPSKW
jgi:REP element-mobilizing transposase RayT